MAGFWDIAEIAIPIAATAVGGPIGGMAASAIMSGAKKKMEGGSWKEALTEGAISGATGAIPVPGGSSATKAVTDKVADVAKDKVVDVAKDKVADVAKEKVKDVATDKVKDVAKDKVADVAKEQATARASEAIKENVAEEATKKFTEQAAAETGGSTVLATATRGDKAVGAAAATEAATPVAPGPSDAQVRFHEAQQEFLNTTGEVANEMTEEAKQRRAAAAEESKRFMAQLNQSTGIYTPEDYQSRFYDSYKGSYG